jgi:hypothetical protein
VFVVAKLQNAGFLLDPTCSTHKNKSLITSRTPSPETSEISRNLDRNTDSIRGTPDPPTATIRHPTGLREIDYPKLGTDSPEFVVTIATLPRCHVASRIADRGIVASRAVAQHAQSLTSTTRDASACSSLAEMQQQLQP